MSVARVTYVGGPTAVIEWHGLRFLTDPTFDPAGTRYELTGYTLRKTSGPAIEPGAVGPLDAVLLSHDHHFDNFDHAGRRVAADAPRILTTEVAAGRLGPRAVGLAVWQSTEITAPDGAVIRVTATPARHGPAHADRGPVIGFMLSVAGAGDGGILFSGDTVFYDGICELAARFRPAVALLCMGAARIAAAGGWPLTLTVDDAVAFARVLSGATVIPVHFEGWEHLSEGRDAVVRAFADASLGDRLHWPTLGVPT
jgi:L-ascorbate metabolism protein UlaG (beta-lactamase superfamily)